MNRGNFLKNSFYLSIGGLLGPSFILSACRKQQLHENVKYNGKVIVIGAGAAGLYAAYMLKSRGMDFEVLEAAPAYGGRLGKLTGFADYPLDLGAQWLHGKNNILGDLIQQTGTEITLDDSATKYWFKNTLVNALPDNIDIFEGDDLPDISFKDYARQKGLLDDYEYIVENLAGDQGAAASLLSVYGNNEDEKNWSSGDYDYKFSATYYDFIDQHIAQQVKDKIRLNTAITSIDYSQNTIKLTDSNSNTYLADKVIITVPITILKSNSIQFTPLLPQAKTDAFSKIGMGPGMKVFLKFSKRFYDENIVGGKICAAYIDERLGKKGNDHILLAFIMGTQAEYLNTLGSNDKIIAALIAELDSMYSGKASLNFMSAHVQNWSLHPFIKGAYSYSTIGMGDARSVAATTVNNKLFFAGEAMNTNGHHQTVFGAVETAYREVENLINSL